MLKVGDWVTQYTPGYWQVTAIFAKYAEEDADFNGVSHKKGDRIGEWVVLKKAFTQTMKPSYQCECVDSRWCRPVSERATAAIDAAFAENPSAKEKFRTYTNMPQPTAVNFWMTLSTEQAEELQSLLAGLPSRFAVAQLWETARRYRKYVSKPPAPYLLQVFGYPWEVDDNGDMVCFDPMLKEVEA